MLRFAVVAALVVAPLGLIAPAEASAAPAGAFLGPALTKALVVRVGIPNMMLVSACLFSVCVFCIFKLRTWAVAREAMRKQVSGEVPMGGDILAGLKLIAREPLLRWLAAMVVMGVGGGTLLYNEQNAIARTLFDSAEQRADYFATLDLAVNSLTLVVQLLLTRFLLSRLRLLKPA